MLAADQTHSCRSAAAVAADTAEDTETALFDDKQKNSYCCSMMLHCKYRMD